MAEVINPVEYRVLVHPFKIEETDEILKGAKEAGIYIPEDNNQREQMTQQKGRLIAMGGNAFTDWQYPIPAIGDVVLFAKYSGYTIKGEDGEFYRMLNDKDISAIINEENENE